MKKKQFDITNIISDDSDSEILNKYSFNYKKLEQTKDNTINCFLRIKPLDQKEKESNSFNSNLKKNFFKNSNFFKFSKLKNLRKIKF